MQTADDTGIAATWQLLPLASAQATWDASPALIVVTVGPRHEVVYQNPASRHLFGARRLGLPAAEVFPELTAAALSGLDDVLARGITITAARTDEGVPAADGTEVLLTYVFAPLGCAGRPAAGVVLTSLDVTAEARATKAAGQAALLSGLSDRMNAAPDPDAALRHLADVIVPSLADIAAVYVVPHPDEPADPTVRTTTGPAGPNAMKVDAELVAAIGLPPTGDGESDEPSPWEQTLAAGRPLLLDIEGGELEGRSDAAVLDWLHAADAHNMAVLPLTLAGQLAGAVVVVSVGARPPYTASDLRFLELVAARAGSAVTQLRGFRQQRQIALGLQRALLPAVPDNLPGLRVAVRYVAGSDDVEIGGDWWDVHHIAAGRTGIGVGDVAGHGLDAAVVMGQARAAMRAGSHADLAPGALLALLDAQLADVFDLAAHRGAALPPRFATAAYAVIDTCSQSMCVANAGHPPMIVRTPEGRTRRVHAPPGPPLGLRLPGYQELTTAFPAGSILVAFTDGLVESRDVDVDVGIDRVSEHLASVPPGADIEEIADGVLELMRRVAGHDDDIALVVVESTSSGPFGA